MSEEKKVLTPEDIAEKFPEIQMYDSDYLIKLIREYGEQQFKEGIEYAAKIRKIMTEIGFPIIQNGERIIKKQRK